MEVIGIILIMGGGVADQGEGTLIDLSDLYQGNPQLGHPLGHDPKEPI